MLKNKIKFYAEKLTQATGIDMKYVIRGGGWSVIDQSVDILGGFILAVAFARLIPQETYGTYSFIQSWFEIFSLFAMSGLPYALIKSVAQGNEGELQQGVKYKVKYGLISSAVSFAFFIYYLQAGSRVFAFSFLIASIFLPFYLTSKIITSYLKAKGLFNKIFKFHLIVNIISVTSMVITLFNTSYIPFIILAYFLPATTTNLVIIYWLTKKYQNNRKVSSETKRYGLHLTFLDIIGVVAKRIDRLLLFHFIGPIELAIYNFALIPIRKVQGLFEIIPEIALPRFARRSYIEIYKTIWKKFLIVTILAVAAVIGYIVVIPIVFKIFFPAYTGSVIYSVILALPLVLAMFSFINYIWLAKAEKKRLYILKIINSFSLLGLFVLFIPKFGIMGAVLSRIVVSVIVSLITLILFLKDKKKYVSI